MTLSSIDELIAYAVQQEEEASRLYRFEMERAPNERSRKLLGELADEELEHGRLLSGIRVDARWQASFTPPPGKLVSEFLAETPLHEGMSFTEVMIYAIKQEEKACRFYRNLALTATDPQLATMLNLLANVEQNHKVRLEEYFLVEVSAAL